MIVYTSRQREAPTSRKAQDTDGYLIARTLYDHYLREQLEKKCLTKTMRNVKIIESPVESDTPKSIQFKH